MKLSIKAMGLVCAILSAVSVLWVYIMAWAGVSQAPFDVLNGFYFGWLGAIASPVFSLILGVIISLIDGFIAGAIFAWLYNKFEG